MARMIPADIADNTRSQAERRLFADLQNGLNDNFIVFHSFHVAGKNKAGQFTEGEIDYLIFSPRYGFLVLEVKGGGIKYNGQIGTWYQNDKPLQMSPFEQGSQGKHKLRTWLHHRGVDLPNGYYEDAVCFPDVFELEMNLPQGIDPMKCILGSDITNLEKRITDIMSAGSSAIGLINLDKQTQTKIKHQLMPLCEYGTSLIDRVGQAERAIFELTENQCIVLDFLSEYKQALIEGCSGSGKTIMAVKKARELCQAGNSVLLLAYNQLIGERLADSVSDLMNVRASVYHDFCLNFLEKAYTLPNLRNDHFYRKQVPELFAEYLRDHPMKYDAIIVDEGQDFGMEYWLNIVEILKPEGHFYIFYDPAQTIFEKSLEFPIKNKPFTLKENCRNTVKIVESMKPFTGSEMRIKKDSPVGDEVAVFKSLDSKSRRSEVAHILHNLINVQGMSPSDVVILGGHSLAKTCLAQNPQIGNYLITEGQTQAANSVKYYTYMKFKGCESTAVILLDVDPNDERWADNKALYISMSRAKQLLYIIYVR